MMKPRIVFRSLQRLLDNRTGAVAVEMGICLPLFAAMIIPLIDLGMGAYTQMQVNNAAQAGAAYAAAVGFNASNITNAVTNATSLSGLTASPAPVQACKCAKSDGSGVADPSPAGAPPCTGMTCPSGTVGTPGTYITVNAQAQYQMLFDYPGFSNPLTLTAQTIIRIK